MSAPPALTWPASPEAAIWQWRHRGVGEVSVLEFFDRMVEGMSNCLPRETPHTLREHYIQELRQTLAWLVSSQVESWYSELSGHQQAMFCTVLKHLARMCKQIGQEHGSEAALQYARRWSPDWVQGYMWGSNHPLERFPGSSPPPPPPPGTALALGVRAAVRYSKTSRHW
ncbi:hypothetical protein JCM10908_000122 [Rhodotorula pacifica]|uniref:uncharacterized protein n=1 Tax=Rhodotorula pacifica TaxID=1495444 RepID=UPI003173BB3A